MSEPQYTEEEKSLKVLYVVCQINPTPTDWDEFRLAVLGVFRFIQDAIKEADASGNYWDTLYAIGYNGKYYLNEDLTQELTLSK